MSKATVSLWESLYPCGENGGWVHLRILSETVLSDAVSLIEVKKNRLKDDAGCHLFYVILLPSGR